MCTSEYARGGISPGSTGCSRPQSAWRAQITPARRGNTIAPEPCPVTHGFDPRSAHRSGRSRRRPCLMLTRRLTREMVYTSYTSEPIAGGGPETVCDIVAQAWGERSFLACSPGPSPSRRSAPASRDDRGKLRRRSPFFLAARPELKRNLEAPCPVPRMPATTRSLPGRSADRVPRQHRRALPAATAPVAGHRCAVRPRIRAVCEAGGDQDRRRGQAERGAHSDGPRRRHARSLRTTI
jgi:hypothetical protein